MPTLDQKPLPFDQVSTKHRVSLELNRPKGHAAQKLTDVINLCISDRFTFGYVLPCDEATIGDDLDGT